MSPPNTPTSKVPWINRQLNKIGNKLHKIHLEGKKDKIAEDSAGVHSSNEATSREVGFNAFGAGGDGDGSKGKEVNGKDNETCVGVVEIPDKVSEEVAKPVEDGPARFEPAEPTHAAGSGSGSDTVDHARTHASVANDRDAGKVGGNGGIMGGVTAHTALNSHPVAGFFR